MDPLDPYREAHPDINWWVFHWGGVFDSVWAETPPRAHVVNAGRGPDTLCGLGRFREGRPGGAAGDSLDHLGGIQPRPSEPPIAACEACLWELPDLALSCSTRTFAMANHVRLDERYELAPVPTDG